MALKATIFKAELAVADMDRHYYQTHTLTIAQHPSETDERMMVRLAVFALHAQEQLSFTKGLSQEDEPDLWQKSLSDEIELWIELGQPDEKRLRQACGRAQQVFVYTYQSRSANVWFTQQKDSFKRFGNLTIKHFNADTVTALANMAARTMRLQCTIQDGDVWLSNDEQTVKLEFARY